MEENKTVVEVAPEAAPAVEETKKSVLNASVAPEEFDWDAFESDDVYGGGDIAAIEAQMNLPTFENVNPGTGDSSLAALFVVVAVAAVACTTVVLRKREQN